jgi:hypothetical protein
MWYNISTEREVNIMSTLDKAIRIFGFENPITITIAVLEEQGKTGLAKALLYEVAGDEVDELDAE